MKCFIYWTADLKSSKPWSSQLWTQFKQLRIEAWKRQDFNGVWTRDLVIPVRRSNQLSYEATDVRSWYDVKCQVCSQSAGGNWYCARLQSSNKNILLSGFQLLVWSRNTLICFESHGSTHRNVHGLNLLLNRCKSSFYWSNASLNASLLFKRKDNLIGVNTHEILANTDVQTLHLKSIDSPLSGYLHIFILLQRAWLN